VLIKTTVHRGSRRQLAAAAADWTEASLDRRTFLQQSGLAAGSLAVLGSLPLGAMRKAEAGPPPPAGATVTWRKNICTHCSVGCSVLAEVANGVWIGQEPVYDSPINRGSHCCKGAAVRDDVLNERRLRYPVKLVDGRWTRLSWDQAIDEIGDKLLEIRQKSGPDSVYCLRFYSWGYAGSVSLDSGRGETLRLRVLTGEAAPLLFGLWNAAYRRATVSTAYHPPGGNAPQAEHRLCISGLRMTHPG
jgi:anaerobic selenocysteine-containing dehydrogenase